MVEDEIKLPQNDKELIRRKYEASYEKNGYSPEAVLWTKEKQRIRFQALISYFHLENKSVLEFGCGFGDINEILLEKYNSYEYMGIDLVKGFVEKGIQLYGSSNIKFECDDFLNRKFERKFDYVIESGIFNMKLTEMDNYKFVEETIKKAVELCNEAIAFNFLTERVNFKNEDAYYINPEKVLEIAYRYSKKVILKNDYMPFDYTLIVYKDDTYDEQAVFYLNS